MLSFVSDAPTVRVIGLHVDVLARIYMPPHTHEAPNGRCSPSEFYHPPVCGHPETACPET
eukprot:4899603-Karenia_brevis.AAC.1